MLYVKDHKEFTYDKQGYESQPTDVISLGAIVKYQDDENPDTNNDIGVVIQTFDDGEFRTDMNGMTHISQVVPATLNDIEKYRPTILGHLTLQSIYSSTSFNDELIRLRQLSIDYIKSVLNFRGTNYELTDPANYEDGIEDEIYGLPRGFNITKHGHHVEYAIVVVNIENNELSFEGIEIGEMGDEETFTIDDLTTDTICSIAELIKHFEQ